MASFFALAALFACLQFCRCLFRFVACFLLLLASSIFRPPLSPLLAVLPRGTVAPAVCVRHAPVGVYTCLPCAAAAGAMGNEMAVPAHQDSIEKPTLPRLQSLANQAHAADGSGGGGGGGGGSDNAAPRREISWDDALDRLQRTGRIRVGDRFTTWNNSSADEPSLVDAKVLSTNKRDGETYAVLEYHAEVPLPALKTSVQRAQQVRLCRRARLSCWCV